MEESGETSKNHFEWVTHQICLKLFCYIQLNEPKGKFTGKPRAFPPTTKTNQQMRETLYGYSNLCQSMNGESMQNGSVGSKRVQDPAKRDKISDLMYKVKKKSIAFKWQ